MKTDFHLDQSIAAWRAPLADKLSASNLTELETHLRESFAELRARGLADDEAFHLATRRLGGADLAPEFAKVHPDALWAERGKWMLFGVLALNVFWSGLRILSAMLDLGISRLDLGTTGYVIDLWLTALGTLGIFGYALSRLVRGKWRLGGLERFTALRRPAVLAVFIGGMFLVERIIEGIRAAKLAGGLHSYGYPSTLMTSYYLNIGLAFATLLLVAIASAFADRWSRRSA